MAATGTRAMRREQIERCLSSKGTTIKEWCELNGVPASTMYFWMSKFRKEEPELFDEPNASEWIEVTRESIAARTALAKRGEAPVPAARGAVGKAAAGPAEASAGSAVIVRLNGADVVVPDGAAEQHIASVLRAVASL